MMIRKLAFAGALLLPMVGATVVQAQSAQDILQQSGQLNKINVGKDQAGASGQISQAHMEELRQIVAVLPKVMQQLQTYGVQQKTNPLALASVQVSMLQAEYMRTVATALLQQTQANISTKPLEKAKQLAAQKVAAESAPSAAKQKELTKRTLGDAQQKIEDALKRLETEKGKTPAGSASDFMKLQSYLLQIQVRLYSIMLAELAA